MTSATNQAESRAVHDGSSTDAVDTNGTHAEQDRHVEACTDADHSPVAQEDDTERFVPPQAALSAEVESRPDERRVIAKVYWHLLPLFLPLSLLCSLDRANLSFAALQLNKDLGFSKEVYGFGSGIFFLGVLQFFILRFILGLCEAGAYPGMWYHMHLFLDDQELGAGYATLATGTAVNGVIGGPLAAALLKLDGFLGLTGWQWLFLTEGIPAVVLGVVLWKKLARTPASAGFLSQRERMWLQKRQEQAQQSRQVINGGKSERWWRFAQHWRIWHLAVICLLSTMAMDGLVFWVPIIISSIIYQDDDGPGGTMTGGDDAARHEETQHAVKSALLSAIPFGCAAITMVVVAWHSKAQKERHLHTAVPLLIAGCGLILMPAVVSDAPVLAFILLSTILSGIWAVQGPLLGWPAAFLKGKTAASGFALMKMLGALGSFMGPSIIGYFAEHHESYTGAFIVLGCCLLIAAALTLLFHESGTPPWTAA
ncbi:hypothetical protein WJX73_008105 [Symbiochloris irregularis]|uniref:Uncharacterized protein n=1 Tax=Symbiochloris irregularis TaxID=706552 RepID=A0AAW1P5C3_9CHLO